MQHRVGGAAQRHVAGQGVADGALVDDLAHGHAAADQVHDGHTGVLGQLQALGVDGGNRAVAGQRDADGLAQAVHAVGRVHAGAGAAARAAVAGAVLKLCVVDHTGLVRADSLEHFGKADLLAAVAACQHRAAGADHGGHVHADGGHDHAGHDLVAVGDQHQAVQLVAMNIVSTLSQISSRLAREYFMPTWPIAMPSQTPMAGMRDGGAAWPCARQP